MTVGFYIFSLSFFSLSLYSFSSHLFVLIYFSTSRQTLYARQTRRRDTSCVCMRHVGAVPSSVVALSAGWQRGCRPCRERGPRGTRRRTPRWFHAVKTVRFLQQLRIAAPPTTDIHIRAIRHSSGGVDGAETSNGRKGEHGMGKRRGWPLVQDGTGCWKQRRRRFAGIGGRRQAEGKRGWARLVSRWVEFIHPESACPFMKNLSTDVKCTRTRCTIGILTKDVIYIYNKLIRALIFLDW